MLSTSGSYSRLADKIWLDFEIIKILYRLNYLDFYFVDISAMLLIVLEVHFHLLITNKAYFRVFCVAYNLVTIFFMLILTTRYYVAYVMIL